MNEAETRAEHIDPLLAAAGWGIVEGSRVMREYRITEGRLQGAGQRSKLLRLKYHDSIPDAVADLGGDIGAIRNLFACFQRYLYQGVAA